MWTGPHGILSRHGHLVDSLSIKLSDSWTDAPADRNPSEFDNVDYAVSRPSDYRKNESAKFNTFFSREYLSPDTVTRMLELCQNLQTLKVVCPEFNPVWYTIKTWTATFRSVMVPSILKLNQLQRLKIDGNVEVWAGTPLPERYHVRMIQKLPLLQSFSAKNTSASRYYVPLKNSLGWHLSQLQHLTRLHLDDVASLDESWCDYAWPKTLDDVSLKGCRKLRAISFHKLIHLIAPNVSRLQIEFDDPAGSAYAHEGFDSETVWSGPGVDLDWTPEHRFNLPALTKLSLSTSKRHELLTAFQDCVGLRELYYPRLRLKDWSALKNLLCDETWPDLEVLTLVDGTTSSGQWSWDPDIEEFRDPIREYCEDFGIKHLLRYVRRHILLPFSLAGWVC